ncbi:MAG: hypothetical protein LBC87_08850 [Fibromonadaceae bacterium]|nr:hypothetical protein [Fibromonadaceae bacterium]
MNKIKSVLFVAGIVLALAFTFSCSGGSDNESGGDSFDVNSQVYNGNDGTPYTGNGVISMVVPYSYGGILENVGSVKSGIVNLELPTTISDDYLLSPSDFQEFSECTYPKDFKFLSGYFVLTNGDQKFELNIGYWNEQIRETIGYSYYSKAGKITCSGVTMDVKKGWTKGYMRCIRSGEDEVCESSSNNILKNEVRWRLWKIG